jgi:hypothetical protein
VERHAKTPEKLLMLVMHELHHVLLGHTRLFPCVTQTQNFVFDCVINALISRMFPEREHTSFLTEFYSDKEFPCVPSASSQTMERPARLDVAEGYSRFAKEELRVRGRSLSRPLLRQWCNLSRSLRDSPQACAGGCPGWYSTTGWP